MCCPDNWNAANFFTPTMGQNQASRVLLLRKYLPLRHEDQPAAGVMMQFFTPDPNERSIQKAAHG